MAVAKQLTLIEDRKTNLLDLEKDLIDTKNQLTNVRCGLFKRYGELLSDLICIKSELKIIKEKLEKTT